MKTRCEDCKHYKAPEFFSVPPLCDHPDHGPIRTRVARRKGTACGPVGDLFETRQFTTKELFEPNLPASKTVSSGNGL